MVPPLADLVVGLLFILAWNEDTFDRMAALLEMIASELGHQEE
jgi:hypothetical protein